MKLHLALRTIRGYHDLSLTELSTQLSISVSHLSEVETGKSDPTVRFITTFAERFKMRPSDVLRLAEELDGSSATRTQAKKLTSMLTWAKGIDRRPARRVRQDSIVAKEKLPTAPEQVSAPEHDANIDPYLDGITRRL